MATSPHQRLLILLTTLVAAGALILAACAPDPEAQLISPDMVPVGAGEEFVLPTPTPVPNIALLSEEEIAAGLPEAVAAAFPGDAANGESLTQLNGCLGCHLLDPEAVGAGPNWYNVANAALSRTEEGPAAYLHTSIVAPNAYVVDGYPANVMPQTYDTLAAEELADIITYLLTLRGDDGDGGA